MRARDARQGKNEACGGWGEGAARPSQGAAAARVALPRLPLLQLPLPSLALLLLLALHVVPHSSQVGANLRFDPGLHQRHRQPASRANEQRVGQARAARPAAPLLQPPHPLERLR